MTKQLLTAAVLCIAAGALTIPARAGDIDQTLTISNADGFNPICNGDVCYYDSLDGYDYDTTFPTAGASTTIGTYTFDVPTGDVVTGITINGTFGNGDSPTTALSDYYLGGSADETAVEVASCDDVSASCADDSNGPTSWTYSLDSSDLSALATEISDGSLDFTYTWDSAPPAVPIPSEFAESGYATQYVYAGDPTIDIQYSAATPEPGTILICFGGFAGMLVWRAQRSRRPVR